MPYIKPESRDKFSKTLSAFYNTKDGLTTGDLNFLLSSMMSMLVSDSVTYTKINNLIGVLECVKLELYRRIATPYEDEKIDENGDVY